MNLQELIDQAKLALGSSKSIAVAQAWKILQLAVASVIQEVEISGDNMPGPAKKELALQLVSNFYDNVFNIITIPFVPPFLQSLLQKYLKVFLMSLVGASIDALVSTFRNTGVFVDKSIKSSNVFEVNPKVIS